jgi:vacuolar protein sorting-associated protein 26
MEILGSLLSKPPSIDLIIENEREIIRMKNIKGDILSFPLFEDTDTISGKVIVHLNKNKNYEHNGIKIELIGLIENYKDKRLNAKFISLARDLAPPGKLDNEITTLHFDFTNVEKTYETYRGFNICARYILQVTIDSRYKQVVEEKEFIIHKYNKDQIISKPIEIEIGVDEWIHIAFNLNKSDYGLKDYMFGEVYFKKICVKLKTMELEILRKETINLGIIIIYSRCTNTNRNRNSG